MQILHAVPKSWKNDLSDVKGNIHNLVIQDHHIIGKHHMYFLDRLSSKEIYNFLIAQKEEQTSSGLSYQKKFSNSNLDWKNIYLLVHIVTKDSNLHSFQLKLLNNVLYLNKMLFKFGKSGWPLCSLCCNLKNELHITCSTNAVIRNLYGTNSVIFYLTLLIFHRLLHRVPFLLLSAKKKTF